MLAPATDALSGPVQSVRLTRRWSADTVLAGDVEREHGRRDNPSVEPIGEIWIRRSGPKTAVWAVVSAGMAVGSMLALYPKNTGGKILGVAGLLLFGAAALKLLFWLLSPRDLLRTGPDGIEQLAVRPQVLIPWAEISDITVVKRPHRVKTVGITVRDPSRFPAHGQLNPVMRSRWLIRTVKLLLGGTQLLYTGPTGIKDAIGTLQEDDSMHTTFELSTLGWPVNPKPLVEQLRARWIAAGGRPPPAAKNRLFARGGAQSSAR